MSVFKNVKPIGLFFILILFLSLDGGAVQEGLKYHFDYFFQMNMEGKLLRLVPYRFFYEASASVKFKCWERWKGEYEFCFDGIRSPGYVMSTGGLNGSSLYFFTADYDLKRAEKFRERKIVDFKRRQPFYSDNIEKIRRRPMSILSRDEDNIRFIRSKTGVHRDSEVHIPLSDSHSSTFSFIYEILGQLLLAYNHPFLPENSVSSLQELKETAWYSRPLNFSNLLRETVKLTSEDAKKRAKFKQKGIFRMRYRLMEIEGGQVEICGDCEPHVKIWKEMKLHLLTRKVTLRLRDGAVIKDTMFLDFRDKKGKGGMVQLNLELDGQ